MESGFGKGGSALKTVLIIGGSRGIGAACVRFFTRQGYRAAFTWHRREDAARALAQSTGALPLACDARSPESVRSAVTQAREALRHLDVLVYSAGIAGSRLLTELKNEDWRDMVDTNLSGALYAAREVLPGMISRKQGRILFIGSIWGQVGGSMECDYSAAKAGLIGLTRALAKEAGPSGITVNCICPGVIDTDMMAVYSQEEKAALAQETPLGRLGTPEDVAAAVGFLAGEEASFITGQILGVNGGFGE